MSREEQQVHGVEIVEIERSPLHRTLVLPGVVRTAPESVAEIISPIWGRVEPTGRPIVAGDVVEQGQALATVTLELSAAERQLLRDRTLELEGALERARTRAAHARDEYQRASQLAESIPSFAHEARWRQELLETATQEETLVFAQMERQQTVVKIRDPNRRQITAPIGGTVLAVHFVPGQLVPENDYQRLFTIADLTRVWVEADAFEGDLPALRHIVDSTVALTAADASRPAHLVTMGVRVNQQTRRLPVWFGVENADRTLLPGMPVNVTLHVGPPEEVLSVPSGAVVRESNKVYVFVAISPSRFERRPVATGRTVDGRVEILRGLQSGVRVATRGAYYLKGVPPMLGDGHTHTH